MNVATSAAGDVVMDPIERVARQLELAAGSFENADGCELATACVGLSRKVRSIFPKGIGRQKKQNVSESVITVRLPAELHELAKWAADRKRISLNKLAVSTLLIEVVKLLPREAESTPVETTEERAERRWCASV